MQAFAAAHINDVGIRRGYRDGADRLGRLVVEDRGPDAAVVVRFPDAAVDLSHVEDVGLAWYTNCGTGPAPAERADHAPVQFLISIFRNLLCAARADAQEK